MKTQTLIYLPNGNVVKRMDNFLYQPVGFIIIKNISYKYNQYDEIDDSGCIVRKIELREQKMKF